MIETFCDSIILREKTSSTAFGNIAIPHVIHVDALKSGIGIMVSEKGIYWDDQIVHIVFLIAIHYDDNRVFSLVYEAEVKPLLSLKKAFKQVINKCEILFINISPCGAKT